MLAAIGKRCNPAFGRLNRVQLSAECSPPVLALHDSTTSTLPFPSTRYRLLVTDHQHLSPTHPAEPCLTSSARSVKRQAQFPSSPQAPQAYCQSELPREPGRSFGGQRRWRLEYGMGANAPQATPDAPGPSIIWTPSAHRPGQQQYGSRPACVAEALVGVGVCPPTPARRRPAATARQRHCQLPIADCQLEMGVGRRAIGNGPGVARRVLRRGA